VDRPETIREQGMKITRFADKMTDLLA